MIKNKLIAQKISQLMLEWQGKLNESLLQVQNNCSDEEFKKYRKGVGYVLGNMLVEIMNPIYNIHPDLKPEELHLPTPDDNESNQKP